MLSDLRAWFVRFYELTGKPLVAIYVDRGTYTSLLIQCSPAMIGVSDYASNTLQIDGVEIYCDDRGPIA